MLGQSMNMKCSFTKDPAQQVRTNNMDAVNEEKEEEKYLTGNLCFLLNCFHKVFLLRKLFKDIIQYQHAVDNLFKHQIYRRISLFLMKNAIKSEILKEICL